MEILRGLADGDSAACRRFGLTFQFAGTAEYVEDYYRRLRRVCATRFSKLRLYAGEAHDLAICRLGTRQADHRVLFDFLVRAERVRLDILQRRFHRGLRPYVAEPERLKKALDVFLANYFPKQESRVQGNISPAEAPTHSKSRL